MVTQTLEQCFIRMPGSDKIRFTAKGKERFKTPFAKVGYKIDDIKTVGQLLAAHNLHLQSEIQKVISDPKSEPLLVEILSGLHTSDD